MALAAKLVKEIRQEHEFVLLQIALVIAHKQGHAIHKLVRHYFHNHQLEMELAEGQVEEVVQVLVLMELVEFTLQGMLCLLGMQLVPEVCKH